MIVLACIPLVMFPDSGGALLLNLYELIASKLGFVYLLAGLAVMVFLAWLAFGRHGKVMLGAEGERPEFSNISWAAMLFCAGIGAGLMAWARVSIPCFIQSTDHIGVDSMLTTKIVQSARSFDNAYPVVYDTIETLLENLIVNSNFRSCSPIVKRNNCHLTAPAFGHAHADNQANNATVLARRSVQSPYWCRTASKLNHHERGHHRAFALAASYVDWSLYGV